MRLFGVTSEDKFKEYVQKDFTADYTEAVLEDWLDNNPHNIIEDGSLLIIGRQVTTNLGSVIDLLAVDEDGNVVVIELKRGKTPRETLAQSLEYASFVEQIDYDQLESIFCTYMGDESANLAQSHRDYFGLSSDEAIAFNKNQGIVIVGQSVTPEIRQTSKFLRQKGIRVTCIEFTFFETEDGLRLLTSDIVVGKEPITPSHISSGSPPRTDEQQFINSLDDYGKPVFERFLRLARELSFPIHWGTKGFSLNVNLNGTHIAFCFGYPPDSVYRQSVYTALFGQGGLSRKLDIPLDFVQTLFKEAEATNLFQSAGRELKCVIDRPLSEYEIDMLIAWYEKVAEAIKHYGLKDKQV